VSTGITGLPQGVSGVYSSDTLVISGVPTVTGIFNYRIVLTGSCKVDTLDGFIIVPDSSSITIGQLSDSVCAGTAFDVPFWVGCLQFNSGNLFTLQMSDPNGVFGSPQSIGVLSSTTSGSISGVLPVSLPSGIGYKFRVVSSDPPVVGAMNEDVVLINNCTDSFTLTFFIEGYYLGGGLQAAVADPINAPNVCDTITVQLASSGFPFDIVYSTSALLMTNGAAIVQFPSNSLGLSYFIIVKSRNTIATWSKTPVLISNNGNFSFTQSVSPGFQDIDGNLFDTVSIGQQVWMKQNLRVTKYRNGDPIQTNLGNSDWQNASAGAFAIYNNSAINDSLFGKLYNWYAVADPRGLCPVGWHIPTDSEWNQLVKFLDPAADTLTNPTQSFIAGGMLKATGTQQAGSGLWLAPNNGANNSSGFTGLPGGVRSVTGSFVGIGGFGYWWSSTPLFNGDVFFRNLNTNDGQIYQYYSVPASGYSVRCVKD
jgi:uncharacterized protein (TIGR02145 family)